MLDRLVTFEQEPWFELNNLVVIYDKGYSGD